MNRCEHILGQLETELGFSPQLLGGKKTVLSQIERFLALAEVPEDIDPIAHPLLWNRLISEVIVPETSFFRYPESFAMLREWMRTHLHHTLRALCVPCSTGEEAFSIAITLREAGAAEFHIVACDASARAIAHAHEGYYSNRNTRGLPETLKDQWFRSLAGGIQAADAIRTPITFAVENIFTLDAPPHSFDFIFCRNLLIYLDAGNQHRIFERINLWLKPGGLLFLGPGEATIASFHGWKSSRHPMSFSFVRSAEIAQPVKPRSIVPKRTSGRRAASLPPTLCDTRSTPSETPAAVDWLSRASELADAGQLFEAARALALHHESHEATAASLLLRGILEEEQGARDTAEVSYRKALYLEPDHLDTLLHLSLLLESEGRVQSAVPFRRRIDRISAAS